MWLETSILKLLGWLTQGTTAWYSTVFDEQADYDARSNSSLAHCQAITFYFQKCGCSEVPMGVSQEKLCSLTFFNIMSTFMMFHIF
jgi:hypothetical protein